MQGEFADAVTLVDAVAPRNARFGGGARKGGCAAATMHHIGAVMRSGCDGKNSKSRPFRTRAAKGTGMPVIPAVMFAAKIGMQLARLYAGTGNGPKQGVMTYDACMDGHQAARDCVAAILAGS
jgi:hypothetical protein